MPPSRPAIRLVIVDDDTALRQTLAQEKGNKVHAAKVLAISSRALYRLIEKHGLETRECEENPD